MNFGLDVLGGAKYQHLLVEQWPTGWYLGIFAEAFGNAYSTVDAILNTRRCPGARIQLLWDNLHQYGKEDIPKIIKLSKQYNELAKKYQINLELSPFCEHNIKQPDPFLEIVQENAPACIPVNTPWKGGLSLKYKNEIHGGGKALRGRYNFSYDGTNCVDSNVTALKEVQAPAEMFYFWHPRFNGKWSMDDKTGINVRTGWPTDKLLDSIIYLKRDRGDTHLKQGWILKSHAEKHNATDIKGDKLLIISPIKTKYIKLKARTGQVIDTLNYFAPYQGGGFRYYSSTWGYLVAEKARRIQGDSLCEVWIDRERFGVVNPAFRENKYREK